MGSLLPRFVKLFALTGVLAAAGTVQRWWESRKILDPAKTDVFGLQGSLNSQVRDAKARLDRADKDLAALPPETRAIIQDAIKSTTRQEVFANPLIERLARGGPRAERASDPDGAAGEAAERTARFQALWEQARAALSIVLWLGTGLALGLGLLGMLTARERFSRLAVRAGFPAARYWLLCLSLLSAAAFSFTRSNPWFEMPAAFYLAPALVLCGGILLNLGGAKIGEICRDAAAAALAPAASLSAIALVGAAARALGR